VAADGDAPRDPPRSALKSPEQRLSGSDAVIETIGKSAFVSSFAVFPLHFFDRERGLCVFEFPPLNSFVACKRVAGAEEKTTSRDDGGVR